MRILHTHKLDFGLSRLRFPKRTLHSPSQRAQGLSARGRTPATPPDRSRGPQGQQVVGVVGRDRSATRLAFFVQFGEWQFTAA